MSEEKEIEILPKVKTTADRKKKSKEPKESKESKEEIKNENMNLMSPREIGNKMQRLESEMTCTICQQVFFNPYTLHCQHTFCKKCISEYKKHDSRQNNKCPICRRPFLIRAENFNSVLANITEIFLSEFIEERRIEEMREIIIEEERDKIKKELRSKYQDEILGEIVEEADQMDEDENNEGEDEEGDETFPCLHIDKNKFVEVIDSSGGYSKIDELFDKICKKVSSTQNITISEFQDYNLISATFFTFLRSVGAYTNVIFNTTPFILFCLLFNTFILSSFKIEHFWFVTFLSAFNILAMIAAGLELISTFTLKILFLNLKKVLSSSSQERTNLNNNSNAPRQSVSQILNETDRVVNNAMREIRGMIINDPSENNNTPANANSSPGPDIGSLINTLINQTTRNRNANEDLNMNFRIIPLANQ